MNLTILYLSAFFMLPAAPLHSTKAPGKTRQPMATLSLTSSVTTLADLVNQRLSYMKDVAAYKWQHQLPIEDLEREQVVIQSSMERAATYGLDSTSTQSFFEEQITAAKLIQQYWFDQWTANGFDEQLTFRDLNATVRPALLELGDHILQSISELRLWEKPATFIARRRLSFTNALTIEGLSSKEKRLLYKTATQIKGSLDD